MTGRSLALAVAFLATSAPSCSAFNSVQMTPRSSATKTTTRLYDAWDDQYAKFYNRGPPGPQQVEPVSETPEPAAAAAAAAAEEETSFTPPPSYGSYLENLNSGPSAPVVEQQEEVYYEATGSYEAPEPEPEPEPTPEPEPEPEPTPEPEPEPELVAAMDTTASATATASASATTPVTTAAAAAAAAATAPPAPIPAFQTLSPPPPPPPASARPPPIAYQSSPTLSASSSTLSVTLPVGLRPPKIGKAKDISYGEASRKFRRTVYSHDDWVRHRDPDRFFRNIFSVGTSGIYRNLARELWAVVAVTMMVMVYNGLITGYQDVSGAYHGPMLSSPFLPPLTLPATPFTLSSPSLGLLLVFRSNTAYQRWDEARKNWGMNINHTRDLVRMGNAYYDQTGISEEQRQADLERLSMCTWAFVRSMKRHLSPEAEDENAFKAELYERLPKTQAQAIIKAAHRPNRALYDLSLAIENLPMHFLRKNEMHAALTIFEDNLGSSERLLTSPVPLIYNRHTARFLSVWLLLLPFALWEPFGNMWNHIGMLPTMAMLGLLLFGIEELATQMEEPFTILPMQAFCDKIGNWCNEIVSWEDGTNGITTNKSYQGRTKVFADNRN